MKRNSPRTFCCFMLVLATVFFENTYGQQKITDTVFYNSLWQICEVPIAHYYRAGTLAIRDTSWYYVGAVKDYSIDHILIMDGEYAANGQKNGLFTFYYPNGKVQASGNYENNKLFGRWHYYYANGKEKAEIYFAGDEQDFKFISYNDEIGNSLLSNGIGRFTWNTNIFEPTLGYEVHGTFNSGKRSGKWEFTFGHLQQYNMSFDELYNEDGSFKKARVVGNMPDHVYSYPFRFSPFWLLTMEHLEFDQYFADNGDSAAILNVLNYLIDHKPAVIKVKNSNFDSAFTTIIPYLYKAAHTFAYREVDIDATLEFKLGAHGFPEDISLTGEGLSMAERKLVVFLLGRFTNIDMPGTRTIGVEGYHDIYIYTLDVSRFYPSGDRKFIPKELFISFLPRKKMIAILDANKKNIVKAIRSHQGRGIY
jgi:antitoxin component YwqK of YwqJK toxin-antitoxin module